MIAGVCTGLGRATRLDPLLFRILLAVLVFFGGAGLLLYLIAWLLLPQDGDTASPVESLIGRGRASMRPVLTVLLGCAAVAVGVVTISSGTRMLLLIGLAGVGLAFVLRSSHRTVGDAGFGTGPDYATTPEQAQRPTAPPAPQQFTTHAPPAAPAPPATEQTVPLPATGVTADAPVPPPTPPVFTPVAPAGSTEPYAPHGPFAAPPPPPPPVRKPKRKRERSILGRLTLSVAILATGALLLVGAATRLHAVSPYFAVPLLVIGLGLVIGAFLGRARWLIWLGLPLAFLLGVGTIIDTDGPSRPTPDVIRQNWTPRLVDEVPPTYYVDPGRTARLDLRQLTFLPADRISTSVEASSGDVKVKLPRNVDVTINTTLGLGHQNVLGDEAEGVQLRRTKTDYGPDGPGGGQVTLNISMDNGNVEVDREAA